ncbi:MAG: outer membrane protein assembly factor BamE [Ghiorsea sp.]
MIRFTLVLFVSLTLSGCLSSKIHQGNVINEDSIWIIQEGDTRFTIESELGSPAITDADHPERALYVEDYFDEDTEQSYTRSVAVTYDSAWRAQSIVRTGFK